MNFISMIYTLFDSNYGLRSIIRIIRGELSVNYQILVVFI